MQSGLKTLKRLYTSSFDKAHISMNTGWFTHTMSADTNRSEPADRQDTRQIASSYLGLHHTCLHEWTAVTEWSPLARPFPYVLLMATIWIWTTSAGAQLVPNRFSDVFWGSCGRATSSATDYSHTHTLLGHSRWTEHHKPNSPSTGEVY